VFSVSDHLISRWHLEELDLFDFNIGYKEARGSAELYGLINIPSAEVSRDDPFGHYCTIGINDANKFVPYISRGEDWHAGTGLMEILTEACRQGAFLQWNHPGDKMFPTVQQLINKKMLGGIEVVNGDCYYPEAFKWCLEHNLSIMANSDAHETMGQKRSADGSKVMTLILAKERTQESIMEALKDRRTIAMWNNTLIGREEHVKPLVMNSLKVLIRVNKSGKMYCEITNISGIPYSFKVISPEKQIKLDEGLPFRIGANEITGMSASTKETGVPASIKLEVKNVWIAPDKCLEIELPITANH